MIPYYNPLQHHQVDRLRDRPMIRQHLSQYQMHPLLVQRLAHRQWRATPTNVLHHPIHLNVMRAGVIATGAIRVGHAKVDCSHIGVVRPNHCPRNSRTLLVVFQRHS